MRSLRSLAIFLLLGLYAAAAGSSDSELRYILILSRHGVRSPTASPEDLGRYSAQPWPDWGVAPGMLTRTVAIS